MFMSLLAAIFDRYRARVTLNRDENKARWLTPERLPSSTLENNSVQFLFYHLPDRANELLDLLAQRGFLLALGNPGFQWKVSTHSSVCVSLSRLVCE